MARKVIPTVTGRDLQYIEDPNGGGGGLTPEQEAILDNLEALDYSDGNIVATDDGELTTIDNSSGSAGQVLTHQGTDNLPEWNYLPGKDPVFVDEVEEVTNVVPETPNMGDVYLTLGDPEGDWAGNPFCIATYDGVDWSFEVLLPGYFVYDKDSQQHIMRTLSGVEPFYGLTPFPEIPNTKFRVATPVTISDTHILSKGEEDDTAYEYQRIVTNDSTVRNVDLSHTGAVNGDIYVIVNNYAPPGSLANIVIRDGEGGSTIATMGWSEMRTFVFDGSNWVVREGRSISYGRENKVQTVNGIALGERVNNDASVDGIGVGSQVTLGNVSRPIAIGHEASATGTRSVTLGNTSSVTGADGIAIGTSSSSTHSGSIAIGSSSSSSSGNGIALGAGSSSSSNATALGADTSASISGTTAIGRGAGTFVNGEIRMRALGTNSSNSSGNFFQQFVRVGSFSTFSTMFPGGFSANPYTEFRSNCIYNFAGQVAIRSGASAGASFLLSGTIARGSALSTMTFLGDYTKEVLFRTNSDYDVELEISRSGFRVMVKCPGTNNSANATFHFVETTTTNI